MKRLFVLFVLITTATAGALQASSIDGQKVSFARLMEELTNDYSDIPAENTVGYPVAYHAKDKFVVLRNVEIVFDRAADNDLDQRFVAGGKPVHVRKGVLFHTCIFPKEYWYLLRGVVFEDIVGFRQCKEVKAIFKDCTFKHHVYFSECQMGFMEFDSCRFRHGFEIGANSKVDDHIAFKHCDFSMNPEWIHRPRVHEDQNVIKNLTPVPPLFVLLNRVDPFDLSLNHCSFHLDASVTNREDFMVRLGASQFNSFNFIDCAADVPLNLSFTSIANQLSIHDCDLRGNILAEAFSFNTANAKVEWASLSGNKIAVYDPGQKMVLHGGNLEKFRSNFGFNTLISTYALFYASYRQQGNRLSANACYNEWKDVETAYLAFLYKQDPDFQVYFNWLMNIFLKTFCDYGTNPVKSMIWSFYVMLGFGLFYFFFPRHSGIRHKLSFQGRMQNYGKWFTEGMGMVAILESNPTHNTHVNAEREEFQQFLKAHNRKLPIYYRLSGGMFFRSDGILFRLQKQLYRLFDNTLGSWRGKGAFKGFVATLGFTVLLLVQVITHLALHLLDALTTSLNAFSTLGFGEIPFQGLAKYLAVLEGFVGWFLLSIFSVSLISQIIQ